MTGHWSVPGGSANNTQRIREERWVEAESRANIDGPLIAGSRGLQLECKGKKWNGVGCGTAFGHCRAGVGLEIRLWIRL